MSESTAPSVFSNVWQRGQLLVHATRRRAELWWLEQDVKRLKRAIERETHKIERTWLRWETVKSKREKEKLRKSLSRIEQWLITRTAIVDDRLDYIHAKQRQFRAISRWLWQGDIDDRDGDPNRILERTDDAKKS